MRQGHGIRVKLKRKEYGMHHVVRTFDENFQGKEKEQQMCAK
jgi:hypothetical protein